MKPVRLGLTASTVVMLLGPAKTFGNPAAPETTCTFERRINYGVQIVPERPCAGQPLQLLITSCAECDHIVAGYAQDSTGVSLRFDSRASCPRIIPCLPDSLLIPLAGAYAAGQYTLALHVVAVVLGIPGQDTCVVYQEDKFAFTVDCCVPPPGLLPFVDQVQIGRPSPCLACSLRICPGDSIPVLVAGTFPDNCFEFRGLELVPSDRTGPRPEPPEVRIRVAVNDCSLRPCHDLPVSWLGSALLPGLPSGPYQLVLEETWESLCDSSRIDSVFHATVPFKVAEQCSTAVQPECFLHDWEYPPDDFECNAFIDHDTAQVTLDLGSHAAIAGLQGDLILYPAGQLVIANLEPVGAAAGMHVAWEPTADGARFVMLDLDGNPITPVPPDSILMTPPVLRVTTVKPSGAPSGDITYLGVRSLLVSDPEGRDIIPCPTFTIIPDARICTGGRVCDLNHDGVADVRDLVLMVYCVRGFGPCTDTTLAHLDCNGDGRKSLDDVLCCARVVLHGGIPDTTALRPEPSVRLSLGVPVSTSSGLDIPVRLTGANRLGAARLVFDYPSGSFDVADVEIRHAPGAWMGLHEMQGTHVIVGLIGLGEVTAEDPANLDLALHLVLKPGQESEGEVRLAKGDFSDPNGVALQVDFTPVSVPLGSLRGILLSRAEPNPFSGRTRFTLTLAQSAAVDLAVHDIGGRRVATVFRGRLEAGAHPFTWSGARDDGSRVRDGVFFLRATGGGYETSRKLVVLRGN